MVAHKIVHPQLAGTYTVSYYSNRINSDRQKIPAGLVQWLIARTFTSEIS